MQITINNKVVEAQDNSSVAQILILQGIEPKNIAVAVNNKVIPKDKWSETHIADGSKIIIIKAVQGG